jgi:hypothetical protein
MIFHHIGIPTTEVRENERHSAMFGMWTSDSACERIRVQYHRFDENSSLHPLLRTKPHVAFKVECLERTIEGAEVILGPYEPIPGYRVAVIKDNGVPIEFVETDLSDAELWRKAKTETNI